MFAFLFLILKITELQQQITVQEQNLNNNPQQQEPKNESKCKKMFERFDYGNANAYAVGLLLGTFQVLYALLTGATNNLMSLIVEQLNITESQGSWIANIEILGVIVTITFVSKINEKFGQPRVFTIGTLIFTIFNLMFVFPFIYKNYIAILICKAIESIGLGLCLPTAIPMSTFLVQRSKVPVVVSVISLLLPCGTLVASLLAGYIGEYLGFQYMYFIGGIIALIDLIIQLIKLPYNKFQTNPKAKVDFIASLLLTIGLICVIIGLSSIGGSSFMPLYACIIVIIVGICIIVFFFYYNAKLAKVPMFNKQIFNQSAMCTVLPMCIGSICIYAEKYIVPYTYGRIKGIAPSTAGIYLAITATSSFVFSPLSNFLSTKIIQKKIAFWFAVSFTIFELLIAIITFTNCSPVAITIFEWFTYGSYVGLLIVCQSGNMMACPKQLNQQIGVLNQISQNLGHSVGIVVALISMQNIDGGQISKKSNGWGQLIATIFAGCTIIISLFMGVYSFERGKKGFTEAELAKTKTFDENYKHSQDLVETQEFTGESEQTRGEKMLSMFNMWI